MWRNLEATMFIEEPPTFEFHDGLFFVTYRCGTSTIRFTMLPNIYLRAVKGSKRAENGFHAGESHVIEGQFGAGAV